MNTQQIQNAKLIKQALIDLKLTNPYLIAGILAVTYKESGIMPRQEASYSTTPAARIKQIFGLWKLSDMDIDRIKKDDKQFFNLVYSNNPNLGNKGGDDGFNYRGRGYNQLTGRWNYQDMANKTGLLLVGNPDLLLLPEPAAKVCARFFLDGILSAQKSGKFLIRHKIVTTSQISSIQQGARVAHDCNGGCGILPEKDPTGGYAVTLAHAPEIYDMIQKGII